jgi:hypothetical protein
MAKQVKFTDRNIPVTKRKTGQPLPIFKRFPFSKPGEFTAYD